MTDNKGFEEEKTTNMVEAPKVKRMFSWSDNSPAIAGWASQITLNNSQQLSKRSKITMMISRTRNAAQKLRLTQMAEKILLMSKKKVAKEFANHSMISAGSKAALTSPINHRSSMVRGTPNEVKKNLLKRARNVKNENCFEPREKSGEWKFLLAISSFDGMKLRNIVRFTFLLPLHFGVFFDWKTFHNFFSPLFSFGSRKFLLCLIALVCSSRGFQSIHICTRNVYENSSPKPSIIKNRRASSWVITLEVFRCVGCQFSINPPNICCWRTIFVCTESQSRTLTSPIKHEQKFELSFSTSDDDEFQWGSREVCIFARTSAL